MWTILHKPKGSEHWKVLTNDLMLEKDKARLFLAIKRKHHSSLADFKLAKVEMLDD